MAPLEHSKGETNRAAGLWVDFLRAYRHDPAQAFADFDVERVAEADAIVASWRARHAYPLRLLSANLRYYVGPYPDAQATQRLKKHATILDKLAREPSMKLAQMEDIGGCRIRLGTQSEVDAVAWQLKRNWTPDRKGWTVHRHRDYVAAPKLSGYRAQHLIVERDGIRLEVQVRTERQDFWANHVEYDTRVTRDDLKSGQGPEQAHVFYVAMAELLAFEDRNEPVPAELLARVADLYDEVSDYLAGR